MATSKLAQYFCNPSVHEALQCGYLPFYAVKEIFRLPLPLLVFAAFLSPSVAVFHPPCQGGLTDHGCLLMHFMSFTAFLSPPVAVSHLPCQGGGSQTSHGCHVAKHAVHRVHSIFKPTRSPLPSSLPAGVGSLSRSWPTDLLQTLISPGFSHGCLFAQHPASAQLGSTF